MMRVDSREFKPWDGTFIFDSEIRFSFVDRLRILFRGRLNVTAHLVRAVQQDEVFVYDRLLSCGVFLKCFAARIFPRRKKRLGFIEAEQPSSAQEERHGGYL